MSSAPLPLGARVGTTIGMCGWVIGLAIMCFATGEFGLLLRLCLPGLALSLALAAVTLGVLDHHWRRFGPNSKPATRALLGMLFLDLAVLGLALRVWVMPELLASERLRAVMRATMSAASIPWIVIAASALVGIVLLATAQRRANRAT